MSIQDLEQTVTILLLILVSGRMVGVDGDRPRPGPIAGGAIVLFALVAVPTVAQAVWHPVFTALERRPHEITAHHQYWRLFTSELVQDGGVPGAIFNLATLAIIATLAGWFWGGPRSIAIFFLLGACFDLVNVASHQAGGGNSGATYGLAATLAGYGLLRAPRRLSILSGVALAAGGLVWALGNIHGYAVLAGGALGVISALADVHPTLVDWRERVLSAAPGDRDTARTHECAGPSSGTR